MSSTLSQVLDFKGSSVATAKPEVTVAEAVGQMHKQKIGALVVERDGAVAGIFTERDVLFRVVDGGLDPAKTAVSEVMTPDPRCVSPSTTVEEAMREVTELRARHLPVLDNGKLIGLVSNGDLTRWVVTEQKEEIRDLGQKVEKEGFKFKATIALVAVFVILIAIGILTT